MNTQHDHFLFADDVNAQRAANPRLLNPKDHYLCRLSMLREVLFLLLNLGALLKVQAQQGVVLTSLGELCFGQTVTLTCTYPDPFEDPTKYQPVAISFAENGEVLEFDKIKRFTLARLNSTASTLSFSVTEDYHAIRVSCYLSLAGGGREESNSIPIDVEELSARFVTPAGRITAEWLAANCASSYNISWECKEPSSSSNGSISTTNTTITVPVNGSAECTLSVVAIDAEGSFAGPNTTAVVYPGFPRPANASSSTLSCTNRSLLLTCQFGGGDYTDIQWTSIPGSVDSSDGPLLTIDDATILQQGTEFWCSRVSVGRTRTYRVTGESYVHNESLTCETLTPSPPGAEEIIGPAAGAAGGVLVVVAVGGIAGGGVVVFMRRRPTVKVDCGDNEDSAPLTALIVAQALSSAGVDVLTVRGCCASSRCQPCTCDWQPGGGGTMDLLCRYREKTVALHILSSRDDQRIDNLEMVREGLSTADHCFALWLGKSVPKRIKEEVSRAIVPEENRHCEVLALPRLPWGMECQERKKFVKEVMAILDPQREFMTVAMEVENGSVAVLPSPPALPVPVPQVDVLRLIHNLFLAKPVPTGHQEEETGSSAQPPVPPPATPPIPDVEALCLSSAVKNYTRSEVLEDLCSVLTILGAEVLSVQGTCRRRDCVASAVACHHCSVYQPDIVAQHNATTFVVKTVLSNIDGAVTADHMTGMNTTRQRLGLSLGILLYDVVGNPPLPAGNCTRFAIGHYQWGTAWVKHTLIVMYSALTTSIAADSLTLPLNDTVPLNPDNVMYASIDFSTKLSTKPPPLETVVYSEIVTGGTSLDPPSASEEKNEKEGCSQPQSSSDQQEEGEISVVPPRLEEEHGEMMAGGPSNQDRPPLPPPIDVVVTTQPASHHMNKATLYFV